MQRELQIPIPVCISIAIHTLLGLNAAHDAKSERGVPLGIVHRDVSPQNVLVGADGIARVVDFGVAKAASRLQTTEEGRLKGKLAYMAPEQLRNLSVDRRTDIFAMGIVLWEMLTGQRLFQSNDPAVSIARILTEPVPPPSTLRPELPAAIDEIVIRALSRDPAQRFATARAMAVALEAVVKPAGSLEVGAWVEDIAGEVLEDRGRRVAEVESISSIDAKLSGLVRASLNDGMPRESVSGLTDMSVAHSTRMPTQRSRTPMFAIGALLLIGVVATLVFFGTRPSAEGPSTAASQPAPPAPVPTPVPKAEESVAEPSPPMSSSEAPSSSEVPSAEEPAVSATVAKPTIKAPRNPVKKPGGAKPNCDPPYVMNPDGTKRFKPDCF